MFDVSCVVISVSYQHSTQLPTTLTVSPMFSWTECPAAGSSRLQLHLRL